MRSASKAVIELFGRTDGKRGGLFVMKRAETKQIGPTLLQLHVATDDVGHIDSCKQILYERIRDQRFNL